MRRALIVFFDASPKPLCVFDQVMPQIAVVILLFTIVGLVGVRTTLKGFKQFRREGGLGQLCGPKRPEVGRRQPTAFSDISNHRFDQLCPKYSHKLSRAPFFLSHRVFVFPFVHIFFGCRLPICNVVLRPGGTSSCLCVLNKHLLYQSVVLEFGRVRVRLVDSPLYRSVVLE